MSEKREFETRRTLRHGPWRAAWETARSLPSIPAKGVRCNSWMSGCGREERRKLRRYEKEMEEHGDAGTKKQDNLPYICPDMAQRSGRKGNSVFPVCALSTCRVGVTRRSRPRKRQRLFGTLFLFTAKRTGKRLFV